MRPRNQGVWRSLMAKMILKLTVELDSSIKKIVRKIHL